MIDQLKPRDYRAPARILAQDYKTMLEQDPKAFDCLIFPVLDSEHDEKVAPGPDVVSSIESGERANSYGKPVIGRALIVPEEAYGFEVLSGEAAESFLGVNAPMNILLSMPVRDYSLIQWTEYATPDAEEPEIRTVYVLDAKTAGRVAGAGTYYVCAPLPAIGEIPDVLPEPEDKEDTDEGSASTDDADPVGVL